MNNSTITREYLTLAQQSADVTRTQICRAMEKCNATEALLLMPLIEQARRVETLLDQFIDAYESDLVVDASFTPNAPARTWHPLHTAPTTTTRRKTK